MQNDRWRYCWGSPIDAINLWGIACLYCSQCIVLTDSGRSRDISLSGYMIKDLMKCVISPCVYRITQKLRKTGSKLRNSNSGVLTWFTWLMPSCFLCSFVVVSSLGCNGWSVSEGIILKGYTDYNNVGVKDMFFSHLLVPPRDLRLVVGGKWLYWYIFASLTFCSYNVSS